ncbi:MAG: ribonuclease HI family protein [Candidatus Marinimicrobia bacterium]|nr:ribonuclease HI family protein [Candidatus Neomarinimicrobiota bacterium]MCF7827669.1 ribonuclease HI family protein [Candidatus Neomarinimicrobiota bacterium]MCF7881276.1 ribonuclease HI family protein [Candidatus Neomarinimicrobiota bacterium]
MNSSEKIDLTRAIFDYLPVQEFLDANPEFSERKVSEVRDEILDWLQEQAVDGSNDEVRSFSLFVDGASQPQRKQAAIGGVLYLNDSEIENFSENIGEATNNEAEYRAMLFGIEMLEKYEPDKVFIYADSELVVKQLNGEYQVKNDRMKKLYGKVMNALQIFPHYSIEHVPRERNKRADQLSKQGILKGESD